MQRTDDLNPRDHLAALEAILMVAETPLTEEALADAVGVSGAQIGELLQELASDYEGVGGSRPRGFRLLQRAGGWRIYSAPEYQRIVAEVVLAGQTSRLTQAALETLAVIAYRQPVTRGRISAIRGVNVDSVVRTLLARGLIEEAGSEDSGAMRYQTTTYFLEKMGLNSVQDLPPLAPYLPDGEELESEEEW
ncbi:SMC-Scp complex subunit ScpB [Bowdeniella massiliensis]|uniref:SMC-Scp complex subunit ScpB n=1 Tax=Bowdeniella massiliensis TaxID=2932264 RepID=UPI0020291100|nr:SMC-Scp complex subunit ScpB [Bowdeniella massiliensis]